MLNFLPKPYTAVARHSGLRDELHLGTHRGSSSDACRVAVLRPGHRAQPRPPHCCHGGGATAPNQQEATFGGVMLPNKCTVMVNCCPIILLIVPVAFSPFPPISREKQRQLDVPITKCFQTNDPNSQIRSSVKNWDISSMVLC